MSKKHSSLNMFFFKKKLEEYWQSPFPLVCIFLRLVKPIFAIYWQWLLKRTEKNEYQDNRELIYVIFILFVVNLSSADLVRYFMPLEPTVNYFPSIRSTL